MEQTKNKVQKSDQVATERDTNMCRKKHGGERRARHSHHPNATHQISPKHTPKQDKGGSICQLLNIETQTTKAARPGNTRRAEEDSPPCALAQTNLCRVTHEVQETRILYAARPGRDRSPVKNIATSRKGLDCQKTNTRKSDLIEHKITYAQDPTAPSDASGARRQKTATNPFKPKSPNMRSRPSLSYHRRLAGESMDGYVHVPPRISP